MEVNFKLCNTEDELVSHFSEITGLTAVKTAMKNVHDGTLYLIKSPKGRFIGEFSVFKGSSASWHIYESRLYDYCLY